MTGTKTLSLEGLCLANLFVTRNLIKQLTKTGKLSKEEMQAVFDASHEELHRTALSLSSDELDELLAMLWSDYSAALIKPKTN